MNPVFANLPTSIFEAMSMAARERGAVNLGQGFPDFGWPEDVVAKAADGADRRGQPISADARAARAARGGGRALWPASGAGADERAGDRHLRRDRGDRGEPARPDLARRRGRALPAALRRLSAAGAARGRRAAAGAPDAAGLADHGGRAGRGLHAEHAPRGLQQPAQPDRAGVRRGGAGAARPLLRRFTTRSPSRTRSGSMCCSTGGRTCR